MRNTQYPARYAVPAIPAITASVRRRLLTLSILLLTGALLCAAKSDARYESAPTVPIPSTSLVISQVYGGGGNSGATYRFDYVELLNTGSATIDLATWAINYASSTGTTWQRTALSGMVGPGQRYLIQQASGGASGASLPTPDLTGTVAMAATAGKVVLTRGTATIPAGTTCLTGPTGTIIMGLDVIDLVGYGSTTRCFEGAGPAPAPSSSAAATRIDRGCTDSDRNSVDFVAVAPGPLNRAAPQTICGASTSPVGTGLATPDPAQPGSVVLLSVAVLPGTNPSSAGITVSADLQSAGGGASLPLLDDGKAGDAVGGDNRFTARFILPATLGPGTLRLPAVIRDGQGRSGQAVIPLTIVGQAAPPPVIISQIFAGGGNTGAPYSHDWVEIFNRSRTPVTLGGWSIQYATATGSSWLKVDLAGTIQPGAYRLVRLASGGTNGVPPPDPDIIAASSPVINLSSTAGKVVLVRSVVPLTTPCPVGEARGDLVGYGTTAGCFDGAGPAAAPGSSDALARWGEGCRETDQNASDWAIAPPRPRNSLTSPRECQGYIEATLASIGGQLPGSILVYPLYSSISTNTQAEDTRLTITNTSPTDLVGVHLFWIDGAGSTVADSLICLTSNQTARFAASEFDPDIGGYLIAIAIDPLTGCPINHNRLIGELYLRTIAGQAANLAAISIQALEHQPAVCDQTSVTAEIRFDGYNYQLLPTTMAVDHLPSPADGLESLLIIDRIEGSLVTGMRTIGDLAGVVYNDLEVGQSFTIGSSRRQLRLALADSTLRITPRLSKSIPNGRTGWMRVSHADDGAIIGAVLTRSRHGHNLHALGMTAAARLVVPLTGRGCG